MNDLKSTHRLSFLLRLWRAGGAANREWQASLEIPETGQRICFATLEELFTYLLERCECQGDAENTEVRK